MYQYQYQCFDIQLNVPVLYFDIQLNVPVLCFDIQLNVPVLCFEIWPDDGAVN